MAAAQEPSPFDYVEKPPEALEDAAAALPGGQQPEADSQEDGVQTVVVDGNPVRLDKLGPMVVNTDGTLSRISNWHEMIEAEQQKTLRIIGKRNQQRLAALRAAQAES
eukprot:TRINITY_DN84170_c0_g1_i1.p1 TRINITY_DN84170_c0_g1~~TRINITY_DN84170_c0_g1_i1.p1  ORF type:complete len:117 (-),score=37.28 TRINITY_DN84170_c0_g1_i1:40-363(-)